MTGIHGLAWFPNFPEKFVAFGGQDIKLYEVCTGAGNDDAKSQVVLATESRYHYARCVQPSFHKEMPIVAVGLGDGKTVICNFQDAVDSSWEYTPRQQRMCLCLAWNELDPNILAIGHDRHRSDTCITIWDIDRNQPKETTTFLGMSESAHSMCWDHNHRALIAGINQKQIKIFDLRQNNATCQSIQTKTVHGLGVAPNGHYLCSYVDSVITLWDLRAIDRPLKHIQSSKNHLSVSWCATRNSLLSSLQRESPYLTLYDVRSVDMESTREVYHVKRQLLPFNSSVYANASRGPLPTALSWHPADLERALLLSETGHILDYRLPVSMLTAYNNHKKLPLLLQRPIMAPSAAAEEAAPISALSIDVLDAELLTEDLIDEIRNRALADYGLKTDNEHIGELQLNASLQHVWLGLASLYRDDRLTGLKSVLGVGLGHTSEALMASSRIESHVLQWPDFINNSNNLVSYRSDQRDLALRLCGWTFDQDVDFASALCDSRGEYSRAAMICVFHLKVLTACDILSRAADRADDPSAYRIAAIALSSFNADRCSTTWRHQRSAANMQIQDAHLRAIFSFLTTDNDNYDTVLNEEGISVADRVAFACKYLSEGKLAEYVKQLIAKSIDRGDLNGLLLTGESPEGVAILQAYLDATFDLQTVALIAINYFHHDHCVDSRLQFWIASYLDCLNSWGMWEKRAELEIKIEELKPSVRTATRTVYLSCNFCGKSVSNAVQEDARLRNATTNVNKLSSCPNCRKPLPRCALCLLHMGTTLNASALADGEAEKLGGWQSKPFSKWFSWCQTCHHGGHTDHILQWFTQNSECPVSSCTCKCFDLDATIPKNQVDVS